MKMNRLLQLTVPSVISLAAIAFFYLAIAAGFSHPESKAAAAGGAFIIGVGIAIGYKDESDGLPAFLTGFLTALALLQISIAGVATTIIAMTSLVLLFAAAMLIVALAEVDQSRWYSAPLFLWVGFQLWSAAFEMGNQLAAIGLLAACVLGYVVLSLAYKTAQPVG